MFQPHHDSKTFSTDEDVTDPERKDGNGATEQLATVKAMPDDENEETLSLLENNADLQSVAEEWSGGTSVHGVALAFAKSDYRLWYRLLWAVLVLGSCSLMLWQIWSLFVEFRSYEVITDTELIVPDELEFPAVTICSSNMGGDKSKKAATGIDIPATPEEFAMISQDVDDFILHSSYNQKEHGARNETWKPVVTDYGQCWQFETDEKIIRPGYAGGLQVYLWLDQDNFSEESDIASAMVFIESPGTNINTQLKFSTGSPGQKVDLRLQKRTFERERVAPWSRCFSEAPQYTQEQCRRDCVYEKARDECQCRGWGDQLEPQDMRLCYSDPEKDVPCLDQLDSRDKIKNLLAECTVENALDSKQCTLPPCVETEYTAETAIGSHSVNLLNKVQKGFNLTNEDFLENFISIHINYERIRYEKLTESKGMTENQLLANIGGSMGLFLGISFLSVWEIVGDLIGMRLLPRLWGRRHIRGLGGV